MSEWSGEEEAAQGFAKPTLDSGQGHGQPPVLFHRGDGDSSSLSASESLLSSLQACLPIAFSSSVQGSCFLCGHHSLGPPCLSGHGRHFAVPRIQIQFSEPSLGTPTSASPPGVCGEPGVNQYLHSPGGY